MCIGVWTWSTSVCCASAQNLIFTCYNAKIPELVKTGTNTLWTCNHSLKTNKQLQRLLRSSCLYFSGFPEWFPSPTYPLSLPLGPLLQGRASQLMIGPQGLLEGLLSKEWASLQESYYRSKGSRRCGHRWATIVSHHLTMVGFHMRTNRVQHSDESAYNRELSISINEEIAL